MASALATPAALPAEPKWRGNAKVAYPNLKVLRRYSSSMLEITLKRLTADQFMPKYSLEVENSGFTLTNKGFRKDL